MADDSKKEEKKVEEPGDGTRSRQGTTVDTQNNQLPHQDAETKKENARLSRELAQAQKALQEKDEKEKKEKEDYKALYEGEKGKAIALALKARQQELKLIAIRHGFHDPEDILRFEKNFNFDADGNITNASDAIEQIKKSKPHLLKGDGALQSQMPVAATDTGKPNTGSPGQKVFTREDIKKMTPKEFKENEEKIKDQMKAGLIK